MPAADPWPWIFACAALLVAALGGWLAGRLRERQRSRGRLRQARQELRLAAALLEGWRWDTDASHRLLRLQAPADAPLPDTGLPATAPGPVLWAHFESLHGGELRQRLESRQPFGGLRVRRIGDGSGWLLRATPRFDDEGEFAGFGGSALAQDECDDRRADQAALDALMALLAAFDSPVVVAALPAADGADAEPWQVRHANAAARRLFDSGEALPRWEQMQPRLPAPLRIAIAEAGSAQEHEGWQLRRFDGAAGLPLLLLARLPEAAEGADAGDTAQLSFAVSHDLRAPVRVVEGFTRIVKEDYGARLDRVGNDHLDRVLGAAARMNQMIDALLQLARLAQQPVARQPVNLSQLAAYVIDELKRGAPERAAQVDIEPGLSAVGDPTLLRQVLENLLGNAWKYSARAKTAQIVFAAEKHDGRRVFVVRDNGAGFDMRGADRLFGLFQRLHSANDFPGTGVGLASVKRIVQRHGGEVWADAEPGRGAAFFFTLRE